MSNPDPRYTSYPPATYHGETGEVSAVLRRADAPPELTYRHGGTVGYLATNVLTDNQFGLYRWTFGTGVSGPDPHFHRTMSESFFVLDGTVRLFDGANWIDAGAGDFLFVPAGGVHGFRHESDEPASMLILFAPGAPREGYFETLAQVGEGLTMTDDERAAFYAAHDNIWL